MSQTKPAARQAPDWVATAEAVVAGLLPLFATLALFLPSGLASPLRIATVLLLLAAAARVVAEPRLLRSPVLIGSVVVGACFAGFGILGLVRYPEATSRVELAQVGFLVLLVMALAVLGRRRQVVVALVSGWLVAGLLAGAVGLWETFTRRHLSVNLPGAAYGHRADGWHINSAFFDNPNLFAYQLAVLVPLTMLALNMVRAWYLRVGLVAAMLLFAHQLVMTDGRAGMLVVAFTMLLLFLRSWIGRGVVAASGIGFWLAVRAGVGPAVPVWAAIYQVYDEADEAPRSSWLRVQLVKSGWHMLRESDWLGVGPGGYPIRNLWPNNPVNIWHMPNAHSGIVEVGAEYGVITLAVLVVALVAAAAWCLLLGRAQLRLDRLAGLRGFASRWSRRRFELSMTAIMLVSVPLISLANSTWLRQPLTAVHLATLVALVAHCVATRPRCEVTSPTKPTADPAAGQ